MELNKMIELAKWIAEQGHAGQFRKDGTTPYMEHVNAVADAVEPRLKPIAYLHDVLEDTPVSLEELKELEFDSYVLDAVDLLTHRGSTPNIEYWKKIATNPDATAVKLADIQHNLSSQPSEHAKVKYAKALTFFKALGYST
jgi:(p)ppGpp synthase/HD superfamily hydrolase